MDSIKWNREPFATGMGFLLPLGAAALMVPFRDSFADAAASLVLIAVVAVVAIAGTRLAGYVAAASAALWFDFFLTRPYEQIAITHRQDIEIAVSLFVVGVLVTELAARSRRNFEVGKEESDYVSLLYEVSELASSGASFDDVVSGVSAHLVNLLHLRDCTFQSGPLFEPMTAIDHDGSVHLGWVNWPVQQWGLPGRQIALLVYSAGRVVGRFVLTPTTAEPVSLRRRLVAVALADQVGSSMTPRLRAV
jgi:K+-sensing histidine kinase KdpD